MSQELLILLLPPVGWVLAWLGGRGVLGTKIWIREGWPLYCALIGVLAGQPWWQMALGAAAMDVAYRLPRGEGEPLWVDVLTALALGVCTVAYGAWWGWTVLIAAWFLGSMAVSMANDRYTWAWTETITAALQGIALVGAFAS